MKNKLHLIIFLCLIFSCKYKNNNPPSLIEKPTSENTIIPIVNDKDTNFFHKLSNAAISITTQKVVYNPKYFNIPYPNGDVPKGYGVCCDVVIRAYRILGIDLQKKVHDDMAINFEKYPHKWGLKTTDKNIDHRRVPNLMEFFKRNNASLKITTNGNDYKEGDIVCWDLGKGITHIGIVINQKSEDNSHHLIVHNIGGGQVIADCLFRFPIIGHYHYRA